VFFDESMRFVTKPPKAQEIPNYQEVIETLNAQAPRTDKTLENSFTGEGFERSLLERGDPLRSSTEGATKLLI
jgi:hypothetical protein